MNSRMSLLALVLVMFLSSVVRADLTHRYSFDNGDTSAIDSIGSQHGTLEDNAYITDNAVQLDGAGDYVNLPADLVTGYTSLTIEFWFTYTTAATWARVFDFGDISGSAGAYYLFYTPQSGSGTSRLDISDENPGYNHEEFVDYSIPVATVPVHVACVYDDENNIMSIYVDGEYASSSPVSIPLSSLNNVYSFLGKSLYSGDPYLTGSIDEFRIYDSILEDWEIENSFNLGPDSPYASYAASNPNPPKNSNSIILPIDLSWSPPALEVPDSYTVYVSDNTDFIDPQIIQVPDGNSCTPELDYGLTYHWQVDSHFGEETYSGAVWNFTTCALALDRSPFGDINHDFQVNLPDLLIVAEDWLADENSPANLVDGGYEGIGVDNIDLAALANNWLVSGPLLFINEFMADNKNYLHDNNGDYDDWIEIYNCSSITIDLSGMYLTDNLEMPTKWYIPDGTTIPEHGYLLFWADEQQEQGANHTNFKLDADGEEIALFDTDGSTLLDSVVFDQQYMDLSSGRYPNCGLEWRFFNPPTPLGCNCQGYLGVVADVEFSVDGGFYSDPAGFNVYIGCDTPDANIYYTTDFTVPTESNQLYTGPIHIDSTTCLRAVAYKAGWLNPHSVSHTYIYLDDVAEQPVWPDGFPTSWGVLTPDYEVDPDVVDDPAYSATFKDDLKTIPSVCITLDNDELFGITGIYANPTQRGEFWERQASVEIIDPCTGEYFQGNIGLRMHGGYARTQSVAKQSLRIIFRSDYGLSKLNFPLFPDSEVETFDQLVLRATWNYSWTGDSGGHFERAQYMRELYGHDTMRDMNRLQGYGRHVHLYINGLYWGLYILTERPDDAFAEEHLGGDKTDYDVIKTNAEYWTGPSVIELLAGDLQAWDQLYALAATDLSSQENYEAIQQYVDIPALIDYMIMIFHTGSRDAPVLIGNDTAPRNFYAIRKREPGEGFVFLPWDVEFTLEDVWVDRVNVSAYLSGYENPAYLTMRLKSNKEFRMLFADYVHKQFFNDGPFTVQNTQDRYWNRSMDIDRAIIGESARWGDFRRATPYTRDVEWVTERDRLINDYFPYRRDIVLGQLRTADLYPDIDAPEYEVNSNPQHGGYILPTDSISIDYSEGTVYYTTDGTDPRMPGSGGSTTEITLIAEDDSKNILVPDSNIGTTWRGGSEPYDDSAWTDGTYIPDKTGGVGYENSSGYEDYITYNVHDEMFGIMASCYIRIPFTVDAEDLAEFDTLTLYVRCDDGFVAFINGVEAASINKPDPFEWNSSCADRPDDPQFVTLPIDEYISNLHAGTNILAIHAMNVSVGGSSDFLCSVELIADIESGTPGEVSPTAIEYTGPFTISSTKKIKARVKNGNDWSALSEAAFVIDPVVDNIRITEIMYHPLDTNEPNDPNEEFIELKNTGAEAININLVRFTNGLDFTFGDVSLAPDEHIIVVKDINAFVAEYGSGYHLAGQYTGSLANEGERIRLEDAVSTTILDFKYQDGWRSNTDGDGYSLTIVNPDNPDPNSWSEKDNWRPSAYIGGSPGWDDSGIIPNPSDIVINEVLAHTDVEPNDWIELHNTTGSSIDITNWFLSDDDANLTKYEITTTTVIPPNGYVVFTQDDHFGSAFALSENGEIVCLTSAKDANEDLTGYRQREDFGASENGVAFGRYYKESTDNYNFVAMSENTPGAENAYPKVGPVVISELMYHPEIFWGDWDAEYIELTNITDDTANLYDASGNRWKITDGVEFTFPPYTSMPPKSTLLLVRDINAFLTKYNDVPPGAQIFQWDSGRLDNAGEKVEISMAGDLDELGVRQYIRVDRVNYSNGSHPEDFDGVTDPWPPEADGTGKSLERIYLNLYGNDPNNWDVNSPTPGIIPGFQWTLLSYDNFEAGWGSYTSGGDDCSRYTDGTYAHQGNCAADIQDNSGDASALWHTDGIDVDSPGYTQIMVDFWFYAHSMDEGESFSVKFFNGSAWQTVASYLLGTDFDNDDFYPVTLYINEGVYNFPSDMRLKFECVASSNSDDIYIDEIVVYAK